jgi:hypothetical protein
VAARVADGGATELLVQVRELERKPLRAHTTLHELARHVRFVLEALLAWRRELLRCRGAERRESMSSIDRAEPA